MNSFTPGTILLSRRDQQVGKGVIVDNCRSLNTRLFNAAFVGKHELCVLIHSYNTGDGHKNMVLLSCKSGMLVTDSVNCAIVHLYWELICE